MIEPTDADIGRTVVCRFGRGRKVTLKTGVIDSFNPWLVFVAFSDGICGCARSELSWPDDDMNPTIRQETTDG